MNQDQTRGAVPTCGGRAALRPPLGGDLGQATLDEALPRGRQGAEVHVGVRSLVLPQLHEALQSAAEYDYNQGILQTLLSRATYMGSYTR